MQTSTKMQEIVTALATKDGLDLNQKGAYLRLAMPHDDPLVIEVRHENLVNVAPVYALRPDVHIADPGIACDCN